MIFKNGKYIDEDQNNAVKVAKEQAAIESHRSLSQSEVLSMFLAQNIQTIKVDDQTAVRMRDFYPEWNTLIGKEVDQGFKFTYNNDLYRTLTKHTFAEHWVPGDGTESLYELIPEYFAGDEYDPIPYKGNMRLELGKYYIQENIMYKCIRDTGIAVFEPLNKLATIEGGQFVEEVKD